jgi:hypothetical protein
VASSVVGSLKVLLTADTAAFDKAMAGADAATQKLANTMKRDLAPSQTQINKLVRDFAGSKEIGNAIAYAKAMEQIGNASNLTAKNQEKVNATMRAALAQMTALGKGTSSQADIFRALEFQTRKLEPALGSIATGSKNAGIGLDSLMSKARSLAGVFGVTLGAGAIVGFVKNTFDAADKIGDLALKMGVSTDAAQRFQFAAKQAGAEIEDVTKAVTHLNSGLGEGQNSGVSKALGALGMQFETIRAMKPEDAFRATAKAIGEIKDPMEQAAAAAAVFGEKVGAKVLTMVRDGAFEAADAIDVMSESTIKRLKDMQQAWENFGSAVTIASGEVFGGLLNALDLFLKRWESGWDIAKRMAQGLSFDQAVRVARAEQIANDLRPKARDSGDLVDLEGNIIPGAAAMGADARRFNVNFEKELAEKEKRAKEAEAAAKKFNEAVSDYIRQWSTGMTAAQREAEKVRAAAFDRLGLTSAYEWSKSIVSKSPLSSLFGPGIDLGFTKPIPSLDLPMNTPQPKARGPMSLAELLAGVKVPGYGTGELFRQGLGGAMSNLPQTILQAITGGGNIGQSIGSLFGSQIGTSVMGSSTKGIFEGGLGKMLQGSLGNKVGGLVANFIPGIGALLGPAMSKLFSAIGGIGANTTKGGRADFAKSMGFESLDNLYNKLRSMGAEGNKLVNTALNVIGKKDEAANRKWMADVTAFFDRLEKVPGKVNELSQALGKFGGAVPKALDPLMDSILGNPNLDPALRRQLEGMRKPSWQAAQDFASSVGIDMGALGSGFNQSRLADQAFSLKRGIDLLGRFAGSDQNAILRDMADEFSALAEDAKKNGVALPKAIQAFLRKIDEMGLLLDANGMRIDASLLEFADIEDEYEKEVVSLLQQIRDLLTPPTDPGTQPNPNPPWVVPRAPGTPPPVPGPPGGIVDPSAPSFGLPGYAGGTHGAYMDFGAGTPVMLHGKERVMTAGEGMGGGTFNIYAIDATGFEQFLSQRGGAEAVIRTIPNVVERWGHAQ